MKAATNIDQARIIDFAQIRVAALEHRGDTRLLCDSVRTFVAWRKRRHLPPKWHATFNLLYNDPAEVAPQEYRIDICVAIERDDGADEQGIVIKTIPAGRCDAAPCRR